jgi:hypothetical protein
MTSRGSFEHHEGNQTRELMMRREPSVMSLTQQADTLQQILGSEADKLARETGFIQRERAFSGADFAQALILGWLQEPDERVEGFVQIFGRREVTITASGLCQRFTKAAATFLQRLLERLAEVHMPAEAVDIALLRRFSGVIVEDSSSVMLPAALAEVWRGCGGHEGTSEATIKLFVRWDVLSGRLEGPRLTDGRHNDSKGPFNEDALPVGGLYLADLGFFSQQRLCRLARRQGGGKRFFVMRLHWGTRLTTRGGQKTRTARDRAKARRGGGGTGRAVGEAGVFTRSAAPGAGLGGSGRAAAQAAAGDGSGSWA